MPFTHFANNHRCELPTRRPTGLPVEIGDEWECDVLVEGIRCGEKYRWVTDQRDGNYWQWIPRTSTN